MPRQLRNLAQSSIAAGWQAAAAAPKMGAGAGTAGALPISEGGAASLQLWYDCPPLLQCKQCECACADADWQGGRSLASNGRRYWQGRALAHRINKLRSPQTARGTANQPPWWSTCTNNVDMCVPMQTGRRQIPG
jgi:hypothetical protein